MLSKPRLLTPGPTPIPEQVRLAMAQDMIHHRKDAFKEIMHATQKQLQALFGTAQPVLPLSCSGTGAMTAAVHGLFTAGQKVLVVNGGKFGERWGQIATTRGCEVVYLTVPWGQAVTAEAVKEFLDNDADIRGVLMQISETSTGVLHPVQDIAAITRTRDVLLVADGISAVGISPCTMDAWGIDCLLTGSQKGLMVPPGLALLALSERAWLLAEKINSDCFYFNLPKERDNLLKDQTLFTSPVSLIVGLHASLNMLFSTGLDTVYRKQWALTHMVRHGAAALGLELFAKRNFTWGITSICLPDGVDGTVVVQRAAKDYGVFLAGGQDHLKGRIVRLGHMGFVDYADVTAGLYALAACIQQAGGHNVAKDYLESALQMYFQGLQVAPGMPIVCARI